MEARRRGSEGWEPEFKWQEVTPRPALPGNAFFCRRRSREEACAGPVRVAGTPCCWPAARVKGDPCSNARRRKDFSGAETHYPRWPSVPEKVAGPFGRRGALASGHWSLVGFCCLLYSSFRILCKHFSGLDRVQGFIPWVILLDPEYRKSRIMGI